MAALPVLPAAPALPPEGGAGPIERRRVSLSSGVLDIAVHRAELPLDALCGFASRRNPKRGFLFVSRVLGRHLPVRPGVMRDAHRRLAAGLPADLPGPLIMLGMAETAIALAQGVHREWVEATGRGDALFLHTTRYRLDRPLLGRFEEVHSHATGHLVYQPAAPADRALLADARTLVMIDDEASTGRTFVNLAEALRPALPRLERIAVVVLTDWLGAAGAAALQAALPVPLARVSLLEGVFHYTPGSAPPPAMPDVTGNGASKAGLLPANFGRLGRRDSPAAPAALVEALGVRPGERVLVLGTGEFVFPPYRLAEALEARGAEAWCQATTRSPILPGGAIGPGTTFPDNYGDGIPNFLYDPRPKDYDRVVVCHETPAVAPELLDGLGAVSLRF